MTIEVGAERAIVIVRDDRAGFDVDRARASSGRLGVVSMQERAAAIGASLKIESGAAGTCVRVELAS